MAPSNTRQDCESRLSAWEGREAVYMDNPVCALVRLRAIKVTDWGVTIELERIADIASPSLILSPHFAHWTVSAPWEVFYFGDDGLHAVGPICWHVYLQEELIRTAKSAELAELPKLARRRHLTELATDLD